jgi:hypothetical protein
VAGSPYAIVASAAVGSGLGNYSISYVNGSLTVNAKGLTITANSTSKTYGQTVTFAGTEFSSSGLVNGDSVSSVTLSSAGAAATATVAGSPYAIVASAAVGSGLGNYSISYVNGTLTVTRAHLAVTANNASRVYGAPDPAFSVTFAGFANGDTASVVSGSAAFTTNETSASPVGSYTITPSLGTLSAANYDFTPFNSATLTVNKAFTTTVLTSSANPAIFGTSVTFTATVSANSPSTAVPTGSVQFMIDGSNAGTPVALSSTGVATYSTSTLGPGTHTIAAFYVNSDGNFNNSNSTLAGGEQVIAAAGVESVVVNGAEPMYGNGFDATQHSKVNDFVITFIGTVTLDPGAIQVLKYSGSTPTTPEGLVITSTTITVGGVMKTQVTVRFTGSDIIGGSLSDGNYQLVVHWTGVHFTDGSPTPPADFTFITWRLFGDVNGDRTTNSTDFGIYQMADGTTSSSPAYRWYFDYEADGLIGILDDYQFQLRNGESLPPP